MKTSVLLALLAASLAPAAMPLHAQSFITLTTVGVLQGYSAPGAQAVTYGIAGLGGDPLVGIDYFTSANSQLYGIGSSGTLYNLDPAGVNYIATVNITGAVPNASAIDFNPVANRLRVYSGTSNYRVNPNGGPTIPAGTVTLDGTLAYGPTDPNVGNAPALIGAAYTNNFAGATTTTLYSLDDDSNSLVVNTGGPQFNGLTTIAPLKLGGNPLDIAANRTGFDITTFGGVNVAYIASGMTLYTVDLTTGALTSLGVQPGSFLIQDVAFAPAPEPGTYALLAVGAALLAVMVRRRRVAA